MARKLCKTTKAITFFLEGGWRLARDQGKLT